MKNEQKVTKSAFTGIIALVFLIIGYQTAVFVQKAAILKILANRDAPDTVIVYRYRYDNNIKHSNKYSDYENHEVILNNSYVNEHEKYRANLKNKNNCKRYIKAYHSESVKRIRKAHRQYLSFIFNPNTVSINDLERLGFSIKQAECIEKYRRKGGYFFRKSDFAKSFVVSDSIYKRLEPYISIPKLDINIADSVALDRLPGIGRYLAAKIVAYRKRLRGFSYKEQLMDIKYMDEERFNSLKDLIEVKKVFPYPLWRLSEDSLSIHPYIGRRLAHSICLYRQYKSKTDLTLEGLVKNGLINKDSKLLKCVIEK